MQVICLEDKAFYKLLEVVIERFKEKKQIKEDKWVTPKVAMEKLNIRSKTSLLKLRQTGAIRYSQPDRKIILYDVDSINEYLEKHAKETF